MARYIDADELELEYYDLSIHGTMAVKSVLPVFAELLKTQPTADVEEVVRCKDCKHCWNYMGIDKMHYMKCTFDPDTQIHEMHFCSHGERRKTE